MKKNIHIYLFIITISIFSSPIMAMESPVITNVTEEDGTPEEERKIEENENRYDSFAAGVGGDSSSGHKEHVEEINPKRTNFKAQKMSARFARSLVTTDQNADQDSIKREKVFATKVFNVLSTMALNKRNLLHPKTEGVATGKILAYRDYEHGKLSAELFFKHPLNFLTFASVKAIEAGIIRGISVCGELAGATFWKAIVEPGLVLGARTIYENTTESGRKQKIDRQYIDNQNETQLVDVFMKQNIERINAAQRQERSLQNNLQKYSTKLKQTRDPNKAEKYKKKIHDDALSLIDIRNIRKQSIHSNELLGAEMRNRYKQANVLIQERYKHSPVKSSKNREKRAQKIAEQYLNQKPSEPVDVEPLDVEFPLIDNEELVS